MKTTVQSFAIPYWQVTRACAPLLFFSVSVLWPSVVVGQEMSLRCIYDIMTTARISMALCGEPLDPASDSAHDKLRAALKTYINDNATLDAQRITPDYDE